MTDQAVILAAGMGSRLRGADDNAPPKPLTVVDGVPLIKRTIMTLADAGIRRVVVVTGFMANQIRGTLVDDPSYASAGLRIEFAHNSDFKLANGISVIVGGTVAGGNFVLSMADHIYTPAVARLVASSDLNAADLYLATDPRTGEILDIDDATKVRSDSGRIVEIGKQLKSFDRIDCGVFAVGQQLVSALRELRARSENGDCSLTEGVRELASRGRARVVDIGNEVWQDVDTPEDRDHYLRMLGRR